MSKSRGVKFPVGNQDEDFSSDESFSSTNNYSLQSRSDSENSSPRHNKASGSSSLSSFTTTTHVTVSTENSSDPENPEDIPVSNSDSSSSDTDCDSREISRPSKPHRQLKGSANSSFHRLNKLSLTAPEERVTKTSSGLIIRQPTPVVSHRSAHSIWSNLAGRRSENGFLKKMYTFSVKYHKEICVILFLFASGFPFLRSKYVACHIVHQFIFLSLMFTVENCDWPFFPGL